VDECTTKKRERANLIVSILTRAVPENCEGNDKRFACPGTVPHVFIVVCIDKEVLGVGVADLL
jgi:hypothetical protein